jgi:hypothetical protein
MNEGRTDTVGARVDRLCAVDHDILGQLHAHRVLTTPQLIALTHRPERTVDYRLARLRSRSLVERTRPYAASGSRACFAQEELAHQLQAAGRSVTEIADLLGVSRAAMYERDPRVDRQLPAKIQRRRPLKVTPSENRAQPAGLLPGAGAPLEGLACGRTLARHR